MAENIEILLEKVILEKVMSLLSALNAGGKLQYYRATLEGVDTVQFPSLSRLRQSFESSFNDYFYFRFSEFRLLELRFPDAGIQVHKYENSYDLSIDFSEGYFDELGMSVIDLQSTVQVLANNFGAEMYCCGYEPAANLETRFFTNSELGPLSF